jgi:hypothetical protein
MPVCYIAGETRSFTARLASSRATTLKPTEQCGLDLGPPIRTPFAEINRMRLAPVTSMQSNQTCAVGQSVSIESVRKSASSHDRIVFAFFVFCPTIQA